MATWVLIMAGGGGTRLWPLSRRHRPKQFLPLLENGDSLLRATVRRASAIAPIERTLVVTAASQLEEVRRAVPELLRDNLVIEPVGRNTAPCIGLAALEIARRDPRAVLAVLPADQSIADEPAFHAAAAQATALAAEGEIVTLGIRPTRPETGFGYIETGAAKAGGASARTVARFVEKPDLETAKGYVARGNFLWNSGMFFFQASRILAEIEHHAPELAAILDEIRRSPARVDESYKTAPKISIDYAVMERLPGKMYVVPADMGWSDVGSFAALTEIRPADREGNTVLGEAVALDSHGNVIVADRKMIVAAVGVEDLVIVATPDAVLVLPKARAQEVKRIVEALEAARRESSL